MYKAIVQDEAFISGERETDFGTCILQRSDSADVLARLVETLTDKRLLTLDEAAYIVGADRVEVR